MSLSKDHFDICKIEDEGEKAYKIIVENCRDIVMEFSEDTRCRPSYAIPFASIFF